MTKDEAIIEAHQMYAYEISEKADEESGSFDDLWQSLFDVCQLATYGIIDDLESDEIKETINWLKETRELTKNYQETEIYFG